MVNSLSLRMYNGSILQCETLEIRGDLDSWAWGLSAGFRGYQDIYALAEAEEESERKVEAIINDHPWRFLIEGYDIGQVFGGLSASVSGRSLSAYFADPHEDLRSRIEPEGKTAQPCAETVMGESESWAGWTLDWRTVDWLIPAGVFAYESQTPLSALKLLAEAAGAVIQTHPITQTISVIPRYRVSTWNLAAEEPDITIPGDLIASLSKRWVPEPLYRGVWVAGRDQGVSVHVKRAGTDGDPYRQMVIDPLITHVDVGRERGRNILCAGGKRAIATLVLPIKDGTGFPGLVLPGKIVLVDQYAGNTWKAYSTALTVTGQHGRVWQTVELERVIEAP